MTSPQAAGRSGRRSAIVSPSESAPFWTSESATAPENAFAVLAIRMRSLPRGRRLVSTSA